MIGHFDIKFIVCILNSSTGELFHLPEELPGTRLSLRQKEILRLLARGLVSKQIADQLFISVNTVNAHRQRNLEKPDAGNYVETVGHAARMGLI